MGNLQSLSHLSVTAPFTQGSLYQALAGHFGRLLQAQKLEHGGCQVAQGAIGDAVTAIHQNHGHLAHGVLGKGHAVFFHALGVAVVGGDEGGTAHLTDSLDDLAHTGVHGLYRLDGGIHDAGVAHHVAVAQTWSRAAGIEMFQNSLKELQVDYIDYLLLHSVGGSSEEMTSMEVFENRYIKNGILDYLLEQREKGVIRNLGFSYHGDIAVFDHLLANHDKYKWDFVQIELNYLDWKHAKEIDEDNTNAEYLYAELDKRGIPAVIMEPLLGGRLASLPQPLAREILSRDPERTLASWAFRFAGSFPRVLTVLSGMTYMEHLKENLCTYCPLEELTDKEKAFLYEVAEEIVSYNTIPCNDCKYCMPCPYGIDIPGVLTHYNKCIAEGNLTRDRNDPDYARARRAFLVGYDRSVPKLRQADHCIGCGHCVQHCPQGIEIPREMERINKYVEALKRNIDRGLEA